MPKDKTSTLASSEMKKTRMRPVIEEVVENDDSPLVEEITHIDDEPVIPEKKSRISFKLIFAITILTALVVGFILGGVYVYFTGVKSIDNPKPTPSAIPVVTASPTPVPSPTAEAVDVTKYEISILNGSGKIGEAGKVETLLEAVDFVVKYTGNAASFNVKQTQIEAKKSVPEGIITLIQNTIGSTYELEKEVLELKAGAQYDVVITVGSTSASD